MVAFVVSGSFAGGTRCKKACTREHDPQCAYSVNTGKYKPFSNRCELDKYVCLNPNRGKNEKRTQMYLNIHFESFLGFSFNNAGACPDPSTPPCQQACTFDYAPVCAYSPLSNTYKGFSNQCALDVFSCQYPNLGKFSNL